MYVFIEKYADCTLNDKMEIFVREFCLILKYLIFYIYLRDIKGQLCSFELNKNIGGLHVLHLIRCI